MDLLRRHCAFSTLIADRLYSDGDIMTVDIPIKFEGDYNKASPIPIEFYLCMRSAVKQANVMHDHFKTFVTQVKCDNLPVPTQPTKKSKVPDCLVVLAESSEVADLIVDRPNGELLAKNSAQLLDVHITDQMIYNKYPLFMRARIRIGTTDAEQESALKLLRFVFNTVDRIVKIKLSA